MKVSSPPAKPLMLYDGECNFCKFWIVRWQHATEGRVEFMPSQEARKAERFPEIPRAAFDDAVQFIETDGTVHSAAEAVFRSLLHSRHWNWMHRLYCDLPGFKPVSEGAYRFVAKRRQGFSKWTRVLWGRKGALPEYDRVRTIFFVLLGLIYLSAFWSLGTQVTGLYGSNGILPVKPYMNAVRAQLDEHQVGLDRYYLLPTLCWLDASDAFLKGLCVAGAALSVLLIANIAPAVCLFLSWLIYLSLVSVGRDFLSFQWDMLLLETGLLAIFFAPWRILPWRGTAARPSRMMLWLLRWLLFRLMFESGMVKLLSGDPNWRNLNALHFHYETQPLPTWIGWYAHLLPDWFQRNSVFVMFVIELAVPFLIFAPRRLRFVGGGLLTLLQVLILLTGNYCFFNWLTLALCFLLLDDAAVNWWLPKRWRPGRADTEMELAGASGTADEKVLGGIIVPLEPKPIYRGGGQWPSWAVGVFASLVLLITIGQVGGMITRTGNWAGILEGLAAPLRSVNTYGLFMVMTTERREIVIEGSNDGAHWETYEFRYKPGDVKRRPGFVAPHQPRLDWQMWFAALGTYEENRWFVNCCVRLLQGSPETLRLLEKNPFPNAPPKYIRAVVYEYHFSTWQEHRKDGVWWTRQPAGDYLPEISLQKESSTEDVH